MIARVFPSKTKATPDDNMSFYAEPPFFAYSMNISEVHVSVTFSWDKDRAEQLAHQWELVAPVKLGGPAYNTPEGSFSPGKYLKQGYVITSRGCVNKCWFCSVWKRNPKLIELPITEGYNVLDDNLLATSQKHQISVFHMLSQQKERQTFTGGIDPKLFTEWHLEQFERINTKSFFLAYDTPDDLEPIISASKLILASDWGRKASKNHRIQCYVLIGFPDDTFSKAEKRLKTVVDLGLTPMAMLFRNYNTGKTNTEWRAFQRTWARPTIIYSQKKKHTQL